MRGGCRGLVAPLRWHGSLLACLRIAWVCWSLQITSRGLYKPLSISCCSCCESLRILADRTGSFSFCFSKSLRIHADLHRSFHRGAATWVPTPPSPSDVFNLVVSMGGQVSIFSPIWFSVMVPVRSCLQGWFLRSCHGYLLAFGLKCSAPLPTLKATVN